MIDAFILPTLYHKAKSGKISEWMIVAKKINGVPHVCTRYGYTDGTKQETQVRVDSGKNIGKSNETTAWEQACLVAKSKWEKQKLGNYRENLNEETMLLPMLAHRYQDHKHRVRYPCYIQQKLNGCLHHASKIQTNVGLLSLGDIVKNKLHISVLSFNEATQTTEYKPVTNWFNNGDSSTSEWIELQLSCGAFVKCTLDHKIFTKRGWVKASDLNEDVDLILSSNNRLNTLLAGTILGDSIARIEPLANSYRLDLQELEFSKFRKKLIRHVNTGRFTKYDIEVEGNHNYFANGILVHNCRVLAKITEAGVKYWSRKGKSYETFHHWDKELKAIFPVGTVLDGEAFNPNLGFQEIIRRVKRIKTSRIDLESDPLQYWVYDVVQENIPFSKRIAWLTDQVSHHCLNTEKELDFLFLCNTLEVRDEHELNNVHKWNVRDGFEGTIIRSKTGLYKPDYRSYDLLKYKDFIDEEFKIIGGESAQGRDEGTVIFVCELKSGTTFNVRPKGSFSQRKQWLDDIDQHIGKLLTVRYQEKSEDGVPIFPVGLGIRDYE